MTEATTEVSTQVDSILKMMDREISYFAVQLKSRSRLDWEDAQQEMMIAAWKSIEKYNTEKPDIAIYSWVYTDLYWTSRRLAHTMMNRSKREEEMKTRYIAMASVTTEDEIDDLINRIAVEQTVSGSDQDTQMIVQYKLDGMTVREISTLLKLSRMDVQRRWSRFTRQANRLDAVTENTENHQHVA